MLLLALLGYPVFAIWVLVALLVTFGALRAILPGRPWLSSRNKIVDVIVLLGLAIAIAYFSQYANIAAPTITR